MKTNGLIFFTALLLLIFSAFISAQEYGKIISKSEADQLFGTVVESTSMSASELKTIIANTTNYVMFRLDNGEITILGDGRAVLYPAGKSVSSSVVFHVYSKSKLNELLGDNPSGTLAYENRASVFSITFGLNTLEYSLLCPPICPEN